MKKCRFERKRTQREIQYNGVTFRDIPGIEEMYGVSENGDILRFERVAWDKKYQFCKRIKPMILKKTIHARRRGGKSDETVLLNIDGEVVRCYVSRLVAMAWCDGYKPELTVNHKDGNPMNNHASNLEWCTQAENVRHAFATGLMSHHKTG